LKHTNVHFAPWRVLGLMALFIMGMTAAALATPPPVPATTPDNDVTAGLITPTTDAPEGLVAAVRGVTKRTTWLGAIPANAQLVVAHLHDALVSETAPLIGPDGQVAIVSGVTKRTTTLVGGEAFIHDGKYLEDAGMARGVPDGARAIVIGQTPMATSFLMDHGEALHLASRPEGPFTRDARSVFG